MTGEVFLLLPPHVFTCFCLFGYGWCAVGSILEELGVTCFDPWPGEGCVFDLGFYAVT